MEILGGVIDIWNIKIVYISRSYILSDVYKVNKEMFFENGDSVNVRVLIEICFRIFMKGVFRLFYLLGLRMIYLDFFMYVKKYFDDYC